MVINCHSDTAISEKEEIDREIVDVLMSISDVSRRIAKRLCILNSKEKVNQKGEK
ncbi:hypothetical protein P261_02597 [Lachnospiraceae bacterium TWA4]|nr:hypothetical protein P261_02597 [Lachnospiraceae bacterium TWA4]